MTTTGNCFRCGEPGHWISDCPLSDLPPPPLIHCRCGGGFCLIKVSKSLANPGRRYYKCPAVQSCRPFIKWCDEVTDEDINFRPDFIIPICPCGAGICRRFIADSGRAYFVCCIKKGFGACGYLQWEGDVEMSLSCDVVDENEMDFWVEADLISSDLESTFHVSDIHSVVTTVNQGIPLIGPSVVEEQVAVEIEQDALWMKTLHVDQATNCVLSMPKESCQLNVSDAMSDLGSNRYENVGDVVSSGSVVTNHEQHGTGEAEWSSPNLQDIIEQYNSEKRRLESVSGKHVEVLSAFMGSYRRLRLLQKKTSDLRKLLLEAEKEMACCEAETLEFGASCREVALEMAESQKRMQETAEKLGKEVEVLKQNEFVTMKRRKC